MKKLFISLIAVAFSLSAMAAPTAAARIKLIGSNTTYAVNTVFLNEDDARNSSYESGYDAESMMTLSNPFSVLIYAYVGEHPCEHVATNNLDFQAISFTTNMIDADYTLQFSNVSGRALKLYDLVANTETDITEGGSYAFSVDPSQVGQVAINDRFVINYNSASFVASVTTNEDGWASFTDQVAGRDVAPVYPAGLKVYKGKVNGTDPNNIVFDLSQVNAIYWGEGVFVKGAPLTTYHFVLATADMHDFDDNEIIGCAEAKPVEDIRIGGQYEIYALRHEGDSPTALYQYVGTEDIPAGKAVMRIHWDDYLIVPGSPAPRRITVRVNETEETQAVENVQSDNVQCIKFIENGEVLIRRGEAVYNLQGQMVR